MTDRQRLAAVTGLRARAKKMPKGPRRELVGLAADMLDTGGSTDVESAAQFAWFNNKSGLQMDDPIVREFHIWMLGFGAGIDAGWRA